jgi:hypothetical protein
MTPRTWQSILPTLLLLAVGGPAHALVIDDLEGGAFSCSGNNAGDGGSQSVASPAQVLGGKRELYAESNPFDACSSLSYAPPAPFDLTPGASATEIEARMPLGTASDKLRTLGTLLALAILNEEAL